MSTMTNELIFMRAIFSTMLEEVKSLVTENRNGGRDLMFVKSPHVRIEKGLYAFIAVKSNIPKRTTVPALVVIHSTESEIESDVKDTVVALVENPKNTREVTIGATSEEAKNFRNCLRTNYNCIADDNSEPINSAFEGYDTIDSVFKILGQIIKDTRRRLFDALDEMDDDTRESFKRSYAEIDLDDCTVEKDGRRFKFENGIIIDVRKFDEDLDSDEYSDELELDFSLGYRIKREVKSDELY
ncbi:MAG: hypothetical protein ACRCX2_39180 [Paraclostridium sp.]